MYISEILEHSGSPEDVVLTMAGIPEKISPFGPSGDFHGLRYSRFAVPRDSFTSKCLSHESLRLVQYPG